jgi:hypothetical protein
LTLRGYDCPDSFSRVFTLDFQVVVDFPTKLTAKERELLEKLRREGGSAPTAGATSSEKTEGKDKKGGFFGGFGGK